MNYADYYRRKRIEAERFEQFVVAQLRAMGCSIERHEGRYAQLRFGDTTRGIEIKYQGEFQDYGHLFIEVEEKTDPRNTTWVRSGIFASAEWPWMLTGDYELAFLISRAKLIEIARTATIKTNRFETGRGFTLTEHRANALAARVVRWSKVDGEIQPARIGVEADG